MRLRNLSVALLTLLGTSLSVNALELYVDKRTQQVFTAPGKHRVRLGEFQKIDEVAAGTSSEEHGTARAGKKSQLDELEKRLDKQQDSLQSVKDKVDTAVASIPSSDDKKWYDKLSIRGYGQFRYSQIFSSGNRQPRTDRIGLMSPTDRSIGQNQDLILRRARLVVSGDVTDHLYVYLQGDLSANLTGTNGGTSDTTNQGNYFQMRDYYADIFFDKRHEYRFRVGQSKVPYGWETLQSSQNRVPFERTEAIDSAAVRDERDLGIFAMWTPEIAQQRFKYLQKSGLRGTGDYGVVALGVFNGQGANRFENNDNMHIVGRLSWPFELPYGQMLEVGASGYSGRYAVTPSAFTWGDGKTYTPLSGAPGVLNSANKQGKGSTDNRYALHAILFPKPFGLQVEWTMGTAPRLFLNELSPAKSYIATGNISGGYVQAMYKIDHWYGSWMPYVKWETYRGGSKFDYNSPMMHVDQIEGGLEWQPYPELELTAAYAHMDRTNVNRGSIPGKNAYGNYMGDLLRMQVQVNY